MFKTYSIQPFFRFRIKFSVEKFTLTAFVINNENAFVSFFV